MNATILSNNEKHYPVLLNEILSIISPQNGGTFIDCTFGQGGYSKEILKFSNTKVIAFDRDSKCKEIADSLKKKNKDRFTFFNKKFSEIKDLESDFKNIRAVIFDLGFSYSQIKDPEKGLSFDNKGPLNMRMGQNNFSAEDVINKLDQKDLELIFKYFGEDKDFKKISKNIIRERENKLIDTPELVKIINYSKKNRNKKINNATKIFQAIRVFVNKEISELINGLIESVKLVNTNGLIVVVTFNSIEDKIVKYFFKSLSDKQKVSRYFPEPSEKKNILNLIQKKPITPSEKEIKINYPSRSAKLRYAIKINYSDNFEKDFLKKFQKLIEVENLSKKL
tara:strand:- start:37 stop:1047 length:1011 start_codon:yes stop_codon:yes gene_type:complete